jgi:hypothetical protein
VLHRHHVLLLPAVLNRNRLPSAGFHLNRRVRADVEAALEELNYFLLQVGIIVGLLGVFVVRLVSSIADGSVPRVIAADKGKPIRFLPAPDVLAVPL